MVMKLIDDMDLQSKVQPIKIEIMNIYLIII